MAQYTCGVCSGSGRAPCSQCGGSGKVNSYPCVGCGGRGNNICYKCNGTGKVGTDDPPSSSSSSSSGTYVSPALYKAKSCLDNGDNLFEQENYDGAIAEYKRALQISPDTSYIRFCDAYFNMGRAYAAKGDYDSAIANYDKALTYKSYEKNFPGFYTYRAIAYLFKGDKKKAVADCNKALSYDKEYQLTYIFRSRIYNDAGEYDKAIDDCDKAINLEDKNTSLAYNQRGFAYYCKGEYEKAVADYTKAISLSDREDDSVSYKKRGDAYRNLEQYEKAIADYNKAVSLTADDKERAEYYFQRGMVYSELGDKEKAIASFTKVISLSGDSETISHAYRWRGARFLDKKEYDIAIADLTKAIKWGFGQNFAHKTRADCYFYRYWKGRGIDFSSLIDDFNNGLEEAKDKISEFANMFADLDDAPEDIQNYVSDLKAAADYGNADALKALNGYNIDYTPQEPEDYDGEIDEEDDHIDSKYFEDDIPYPAGQSGSPSSGGSSSDATYTAFQKSAFAAFLEKIGFVNAPYGLGLGPILSVILGVLITVGVGFLLRAVFHSVPFLISVIVFALAFASLRFTHKKLIVILSIIAAIGITISGLGRSGKLPAKTPAPVEQVESVEE